MRWFYSDSYGCNRMKQNREFIEYSKDISAEKRYIFTVFSFCKGQSASEIFRLESATLKKPFV